MGRIKIGRVTGPAGLAGGFKVYDYGDDPARYAGFTEIIMGERKYHVSKTGTRKGLVFLEVEGIDDRDKAEAVRNMDVYIDEAELPEAGDGSFYIKDLLGSAVVDEEGKNIGTLSDIRTDTAQDLYVVTRDDGEEIYIPGVPEFIIERDVKKKIIRIRIIEGLI